MDKLKLEEQVVISNERSENSEKIFAYLESKLGLYSGYKDHFDSIPNLKQILFDYLVLPNEDKLGVKKDITRQLIQAGVYNSEGDVIEFLLLIAEQERFFEDCPDDNVSDEDLCRYYFDKYKFDENWASIDYDFFRRHTSSRQTERHSFFEEVALVMIAKSRASVEKAIQPTPREIAELIEEVNSYFQKAFYAVFGFSAPLSLGEVTFVTSEYTEHADRISGKTFIDIQNYRKNREQFIHFVIHEAMHLCFDGFKEKRVEEALIEYFIEKMFEKFPPDNFSYTPVSSTYQEWKECLKALFQALPEIEKYFIMYFQTQDIRPLIDFFRENLSEEIKREIVDNHYRRGISDFMSSVMKL